MSRSIWIVNKEGWEYDDSYYYKYGSGGQPHQAFTDKEIAESFLRDLELSEITDIAPILFRDYIKQGDYDIDDEYHKDILDLRNKKLIQYDGYNFDYTKPVDEYSGEELLSIGKAFGITFFSLIEVELVA